MKKFLILFFAISLVSSSHFKEEFFTAQFPDKIVFKGKEYSLNVNPMESYFEKFPKKRPRGGIISSALWRGYIAHFKIIKDQLFLTDIEIEVHDEDSKDEWKTKWVSVYDKVFPEKDKILVDWYSGILVLPYGTLESYVHLAYGSTWSNYWLIEVEKGTSNEVRNYDAKEFTEFKKRQFEVFKKTEQYKALYDQLKNDDEENDEKFLENFIYSYITDYTTKFLKN